MCVSGRGSEHGGGVTGISSFWRYTPLVCCNEHVKSSSSDSMGAKRTHPASLPVFFFLLLLFLALEQVWIGVMMGSSFTFLHLSLFVWINSLFVSMNILHLLLRTKPGHFHYIFILFYFFSEARTIFFVHNTEIKSSNN